MNELQQLHLEKRIEKKLIDAGYSTIASVESALRDGLIHKIDGIGPNTERSIRNRIVHFRESQIHPVHRTDGIDFRYFVVGCILLATAIGLAIYAFEKRILTGSQIVILKWLLPLASGFCAGSFIGSFTIKSKGALPGIVATATGGFGVWFLTFIFFPNDSTVDPPPLPPPIPSSQISKFPEAKYSRLTDQDRKSKSYNDSIVRIINKTQFPISVGYSFLPQHKDPEAIDEFAHILTETVDPNVTELDERYGFGGPIHISIFDQNKWHLLGWFDLEVVPERTLTIFKTVGPFECRLKIP